MTKIAKIKEPIAAELIEFEAVLDSVFEVEDKLLKDILVHITKKKGKQIRAIFTLLCAKLCGKIDKNALRCAAAYEILHCGTLVHDDVVDETMVRRGQASVNAIFDNRAAVLSGDFLLSCAMQLITETENPVLMALLAQLGKTLSRGELLQLQYSFNTPTEEQYFDIIAKKTAVLFTTCAASAAVAVGVDKTKEEAIVRFAQNLGLCFQIKDDIFDYTPNNATGKPALNDIKEGKITLPLLHAMKNISDTEKAFILNTINDGEVDDHFNGYLLDLINKNGGVNYSYSVIEQFKNEALNSLAIFDDCAAKEALVELLNFVIERDK